MANLDTETTPHYMADWAIEESLASGATVEDIAHDLHQVLSRDEAKRLVTQLLIDKCEYSADLHDDETATNRMNSLLTEIAVDVQRGFYKYIK